MSSFQQLSGFAAFERGAGQAAANNWTGYPLWLARCTELTTLLRDAELLDERQNAVDHLVAIFRRNRRAHRGAR